ncbi:hypothetical protein Q9189_007053 [Teloschistes chrysophthalmus]
MAASHPSSLVSAHNSSDSGLQIHLHPLVLLTVSDLITRHILRQREGPIVGALLGQHNGRDMTLEHAFECQVIAGDPGHVLLHQDWFQTRLMQYKDVHKEPALELVGWFTATPSTGPEMQHVPIHRQIIQNYNETAVLLAFHPSEALAEAGKGGKLPLTIYESIYESTQSVGKSGRNDTDADQSMDVDGQEAPLDLKFRELTYSIETGEAEMIGVDFVARGGGNATNVDTSTKQKGKGQASQAPVTEGDSKLANSQQEAKAMNDASLLSPEDDERKSAKKQLEGNADMILYLVITSLTARANAVKMLHTRIQVLKAYLTHLPPSYLTNAAEANGKTTTKPTTSSQVDTNHVILRSIQALINRLPILIPADGTSFNHESLAEKSDVALVSLLGDLTKSTKEMREMGKKFEVVNNARQRKRGGSQYNQTYTEMDGLAEEQMAPMG